MIRTITFPNIVNIFSFFRSQKREFPQFSTKTKLRDESESVPILKRCDTESYEVYKIRWYILMLFSVLCCNQRIVSDSFAPIAGTMRRVIPDWTNTNTLMVANLGCIAFIVFIGPVCCLLEQTGLRTTCLIASGLMTIGTILRAFFFGRGYLLSTAYICAVLNGFACAVIESAPGALSATWFSSNERMTATATSQIVTELGEGVVFLLSKYMVSDKSLDNSLDTLLSNNTYGDYNMSMSSDELERGQYLIQNYLSLQTAISSIIFIALLVYFPSKPKSAPTLTASLYISNKENAIDLNGLISNKSIIMCIIGYAISTGTQSAWFSILTVNFESLGVNDTESGKIGIVVFFIGVIPALAVSLLMDHVKRKIKAALFFVLSMAFVAYGWLILLVNNGMDFSMRQLYTSVICAGSSFLMLTPLFFEYTTELAYPVPEGFVGGFLSICHNTVSILFYLAFVIGDLDHVWMQYFVCASTFLVIPLLLVTKEEYKRSEVDEMEISSDKN